MVILKTMQERFTVPPARAIGVASVLRWKRHRTNGALSPRSYHKQTSQVTLTPAHIRQPKLVAGPRGTGFPPVQPKESARVHVLKLFSYI
jgi:hypothetical protein